MNGGETMVYIIVGAFILLDLITGLIKAFKTKEYTSSIMREGLFHKVGSILVVSFGVLVDYAQAYLDLGVNVPIATSICVYIVLMEIGSSTSGTKDWKTSAPSTQICSRKKSNPISRN